MKRWQAVLFILAAVPVTWGCLYIYNICVTNPEILRWTDQYTQAHLSGPYPTPAGLEQWLMAHILLYDGPFCVVLWMVLWNLIGAMLGKPQAPQPTVVIQQQSSLPAPKLEPAISPLWLPPELRTDTPRWLVARSHRRLNRSAALNGSLWPRGVPLRSFSSWA